MIKKIIRKSLRSLKRWLEEDGNSRQKSGYSPGNEFGYHWLNQTLFPEILAENDVALRPNYTWGVVQGVHLAKSLDIGRVSVIEFGVAGGNGLILLEKIAQKVESIFGMEIDVYGFDTGVGLPKCEDCRDLPNIYSEGRHPMDVEKLKKRLRRAQLVLGLVQNSIEDFIRSKPSPIAFVSIDLDLYSATVAALRCLNAAQELLLPRIHCYFDDIMGLTCSDYNGGRLAIADFNASSKTRKISPIYGLRYYLPAPYSNQMWTEQFYMAHIFDHDLYKCDDGLAPMFDCSLADD